jgi:hypothetical protein
MIIFWQRENIDRLESDRAIDKTLGNPEIFW